MRGVMHALLHLQEFLKSSGTFCCTSPPLPVNEIWTAPEHGQTPSEDKTRSHLLLTLLEVTS